MIVFPSAKINLGLQITAKRSDGYHNIDSVFYPIPLTDALEIVMLKSGSGITFSSSGLDIPGEEENNLCVKAYKLLNATYTLPAIKMHLLKKIPMGAGLGGGSADGAFAIKLLNDLCDLQLSNTELERWSLQLGSDCPFFIENTPKHVTGRGEKMNPIDLNLKGLYLGLVFPGIHIGTANAYSGIVPKDGRKTTKSITTQPLSSWRGDLVNDFETPAFDAHPSLPAIKNELYNKGAIYASMTGSGSTMYGLFEKMPELSTTSFPYPTWKAKL